MEMRIDHNSTARAQSCRESNYRRQWGFPVNVYCLHTEFFACIRISIDAKFTREVVSVKHHLTEYCDASRKRNC